MPDTHEYHAQYRDSVIRGTFQRLKFRPLRTPELDDAWSARRKITPAQTVAVTGILTALFYLAITQAGGLGAVLIQWLFWICFAANSALRFAACSQKPPTAVSPATDNLPRYTVLVALYREAAVAAQLATAMHAIDYPHDRIEVFFALEADDLETHEALIAQALPGHMRIVIVPDSKPRTKPRALNHALGQASGDYIVVYDAEDRPHPLQLREAAARFAAADDSLACLQAPLRPLAAGGFVARQFMIEYAVQFDILLPAMHRLEMPFPLGGTSNHLRVDTLRKVGGWDAYNVTEDADLGIRLAQFGYRSEMMHTPTYETPPNDAKSWVPQRARWIKGHMQTIGVHSRLNVQRKFRAWLGLFFGVILSVAAAICYAPWTVILVTRLIPEAILAITDPAHRWPLAILPDLGLFILGTLTGLIAMAVGAQRAGIRLKISDLLLAPFYWAMQSVAAVFALFQLLFRPHHWDKTEHVPEPETAPETFHENDFTTADVSPMP